MKNLMAAPLCLLLLMVLGLVQGQSQYNNMCVSCVMANSSNYYCSNTNLCSNVSIPIQSCDQGLNTCLSYSTQDLGVFEIPPFTPTKASFNQTVRAGQGVRFAIANEDSKVKAWFKLILKTATAATVSTVNLVDSTDINSISAQILSQVPPGVIINYFDQNTGIMSPYLYSFMGRSYLKPLNTRFIYLATTTTDIVVQVIYGNINLII